MQFQRPSLLSFGFCLAVLLSVSCSTKKNTFVNRTFHNLTSRFNGFYYAGESLKEGVTQIEKIHKDNYDKVLPVFKYGKPDDAKSIYPQMDKTFKKSSLVIERHSMLIKGKEYIKWIDDNYLLIGKSHFYKRDYFAGLEVFDYISRQYKNQETRFDARLWMIRTYNELGIFDQASAMIDLLKDDKQFPKKYAAEFAAVQADFFLKQEIYSQAEFFLTKALFLTKKKKVKARYAYILGQILLKQGKKKEANKYFLKVISLHPEYEMTFNARMNVARTIEAGSSGSKLVKKQLNKMLKDAKNLEYRDQIYYALAEIALREKDTLAAAINLQQSVKASITNNDQKAKSFLLLADLRFDRTDYPSSQAYYDSAMTLINKDFPGYEQLLERKKTLTSLVNNLRIVAYEDSLQKLAGMSEKDREAFVDALIAKLEEEEKRRKEEEELAKQNAINVNPTAGQPQQTQANASSGSSWYFYNPSTLSFGFTEFLKKWGSRKLEDNWRRSNKQTIVTDESGVAVAVDSTVAGPQAAAVVKRDKASMLKNIPVGEEAKQKSDSRIIEALYSIGFLYKEQLLNDQKAILTFEELLKRYPKSKYTLPLYYQLHRLHAASGNQAKADKYKNILLTEHPESEYAQILKNPEYLQQVAAKGSEAEQQYRAALAAFERKEFAQVNEAYETAKQRFSKTKFFPRFALLNALALGGKRDLAEYEKSLKEIVVKFPKDPVKEEAEALLAGLARIRGEATTEKADSITPGLYAINPAAEHYFILLVNGPGFNAERQKINLADFNAEFFSTVTLEMTSVALDTAWTMITVKSFPDQAKATDYLVAIKDNANAFKEAGTREKKLFIISIDNYPVFYKDKRIPEYEAFFRKNY